MFRGTQSFLFETDLIFAYLSDYIIVFVFCICSHQIIGRCSPAVGVNVSGLWLGEVGRREALDWVTYVLFGEYWQRQKQEDQKGVLSIQFVHTIVYGYMDPTDQIVEPIIGSSGR